MPTIHVVINYIAWPLRGLCGEFTDTYEGLIPNRHNPLIVAAAYDAYAQHELGKHVSCLRCCQIVRETAGTINQIG